MNKKPLILGIETSCDETAASLISENERGIPIILSNIISSQTEVHKEFGGVVPELAARSHLEKIDWIVQKALDESGKKLDEIDAVAATAGPGLVVCLSVGLSFGKTFSNLIKKPFIAVSKLMHLNFYYDALNNFGEDPEFFTDLLHLGLKVGKKFAPHAKIS